LHTFHDTDPYTFIGEPGAAPDMLRAASRAVKAATNARHREIELVSKTEPVSGLSLLGTELEPELRDYFRACEEKLGFVPNVLKAFAFDNKKLKCFIDMVDDLMLGESGLSRLDREMIAVAVSAVNHCHYCLTAHGSAVRYRSNDPMLGDTIEHNYRVAALTLKQKAMLDFAVKLTEAPDKIENSDRDMLRQLGFTDRDIWDISAVAAFFNMSNRLASAADMRPNAEYYGMARAKRADADEAGR
jgi:uncharacterized peroxidase-related enzyme